MNQVRIVSEGRKEGRMRGGKQCVDGVEENSVLMVSRGVLASE